MPQRCSKLIPSLKEINLKSSNFESMKKNTNTSKEVRINRIDSALHQQLVNISRHKGITITSMLKPVLKDFVENQPERFKQPYKYDD